MTVGRAVKHALGTGGRTSAQKRLSTPFSVLACLQATRRHATNQSLPISDKSRTLIDVATASTLAVVSDA